MDNPGHYDEYPELTRADEERERAKKADTTTNTGAASLSDEQKKQIAAVVHRDCALIPGANFYTAAELAITATLAQISRATRTPQADADFKNFHRLLCERFGYVHDERDWKRDQLSLIEHIASGAAIAAGGAQEAARVDTGPNLEGLREKLLAPRSIERTSDGWLYHPDYPTCDEGTRADKFLEAFGIETAFVGMESDAPDLAERWHEEGLTDCSEWTPTPPGGDGWLLLEIYDTEDGPYALFGRDHYAAEQARKKEHTRRLSEAVRRARLERAAASNGEQGANHV